MECGCKILVNENLIGASREKTSAAATEQHSSGSYLVHWCAPEIIEKDIFNGRMWSQIAILLDGGDVVEDEATIESIVVAKDANKNYCRSIHV
jgi:hypothetical protein